jgi:hypothetical protein
MKEPIQRLRTGVQVEVRKKSGEELNSNKYKSKRKI